MSFPGRSWVCRLASRNETHRKSGQDGRCKTPVGNTVDVKKASWKNTIGEPDLIAVWKDPDFDPKARAFY